MDIKIISKSGNKTTLQCGCGRIRTVFNGNVSKLLQQKGCRCKKVEEKVPVLKIRRNSNPSLDRMGFKLIRYKVTEPLNTEYYLNVCKDGRFVFEGCEGVIGNFAEIWADPKTKRIALQSSASGDIRYRKSYVVTRKELAWATPKVSYKVKGKYNPSVKAVIFQL